jgi:hypothetical protein
MTQISTAAPQVKDALYQISKTLFKDDPLVLVALGHPGTATNDDMVMWLDVRTSQTEGPLSVTNRGREEQIDIDVFISSFRAGELDADKVPSDRVYWLLGQIENFVRTTDTTLGNLVRHCFVTATHSRGSTEPAVIANGRQVDLIATFTAHTRITN